MHRDEVARAEQRYRIEALEVRAAEEYGVDLPTLLAEYGPAAPVPPTPEQVAAAEAAGEPEPDPVPYDRAVQERRAAKAERDLATLGKVNPLALEEFAALEERHGFLATQLEDLKSTRRDLLTVVREVDERIHDVFAAAFADVQREFEQVFATLFPGGQGRLVLTDPEDLLATGIEVEARPPGKKVKRLSLLSGGERSLTAVALLVAIFRARPSPFYVLDEVEAALDDVNLGRLLTLVEQLRSTSQLIIITHQKRTMEIADALYGVSMRGDGITGVISQRLRELETGLDPAPRLPGRPSAAGGPRRRSPSRTWPRRRRRPGDPDLVDPPVRRARAGWVCPSSCCQNRQPAWSSRSAASSHASVNRSRRVASSGASGGALKSPTTTPVSIGLGVQVGQRGHLGGALARRRRVRCVVVTHRAPPSSSIIVRSALRGSPPPGSRCTSLIRIGSRDSSALPYCRAAAPSGRGSSMAGPQASCMSSARESSSAWSTSSLRSPKWRSTSCRQITSASAAASTLPAGGGRAARRPPPRGGC